MRRRVSGWVCAVSLVVVVPASARAADIEDLSLEDLLDMPVTSASGSAIPAREAPGVIVRVERADILRSGARDLAEVLRFVSAVAPGLDVLSSASLGVRGIWGSEGKILVLVDGVPVSERLYGSTSIGARIPAEVIDHVDVLRGPGGVVHGRYAQLAVIDVVTVGGADEPVSVGSVRAGAAAHGWDDVGVTAATVAPLGKGTVGTTLWAGATRPYAGSYTDAEGTVSDVGGTRHERARAAVRIDQESWRLQAYAERYAMLQDTGYGYTLPEPVFIEFDQLGVDVSGDLAAGEATVTPRLVAFWQAPWRVDRVPSTDPNYYRGDVGYASPRVDVVVPLGEDVEWTVGAEGSVTHAIADRENPADYTVFANGERRVTYATAGAFTQLVGRWKWATVAGGARVDAQTSSKMAVVPRLAITRTFGDSAHAKFLVAQAFRPPDVQNFAFATEDLAPELTTAAEIEGGFRPVRNTYLSASLFLQRVERPITYTVTYDPVLGPSEGYTNGDPVASRGADLTFRWQDADVSWTTSAAAYRLVGQPLLATTLGQPNLRVFTSAGVRPVDHVWLTPSVLVTSKNPAVVGFDDDGASIVEDLPWAAQVDLCARFEDLTRYGLAVDVGAKDLFDARPALVQGYDSGHLPIPTEGRSAFVRVGYAR